MTARNPYVNSSKTRKSGSMKNKKNKRKKNKEKNIIQEQLKE